MFDILQNFSFHIKLISIKYINTIISFIDLKEQHKVLRI